MRKKSKHPYHDDPSAFGKRWPIIRELNDPTFRSALENVYDRIRYFKMGKIRIALTEPDRKHGYFMSIQGRDTYPSWDEIVWIRYSLIPDAALMSLRLPNLNTYINYEDSDACNVFTLEQTGWAIDPPPTCSLCNFDMELLGWVGTDANMRCPICQETITIDMTTWNEQHGNGLHGKVKS